MHIIGKENYKKIAGILHFTSLFLPGGLLPHQYLYISFHKPMELQRSISPIIAPGLYPKEHQNQDCQDKQTCQDSHVIPLCSHKNKSITTPHSLRITRR